MLWKRGEQVYVMTCNLHLNCLFWKCSRQTKNAPIIKVIIATRTSFKLYLIGDEGTRLISFINSMMTKSNSIKILIHKYSLISNGSSKCDSNWLWMSFIDPCSWMQVTVHKILFPPCQRNMTRFEHHRSIEMNLSQIAESIIYQIYSFYIKEKRKNFLYLPEDG